MTAHTLDQEPREHVVRTSPPWRAKAGLTECGLKAAELNAVITRDQLITKLRQLGKTRTAMTTCITCWQTAARHKTWDDDPISVIAREAERWQLEDKQTFRNELVALAELADRHRDEFEAVLAGLGDTIRLADRRQRRGAAS